MVEAQVSQQGDQGTQDQQNQQQQSLGWRAGLPDDLKNHEAFTPYKTVGDLGKVHIETVGKVKNLEGKLANAIFKPGEKATPEEQSAYRKAMDVPDKPEQYEFPQPQGKGNSPEMVKWAQGLFHRVGMPKSMASEIGKEWNSFVAGMVEAEEKMVEQTKTENEKKFREQFKSEDEHKAGMELTRRFWKKITNTDFDTVYKEAEAWQVPLFMNFIFNTAKAIGEDWSPKGGGTSTGEVQLGIKYKDMDKFKGG